MYTPSFGGEEIRLPAVMLEESIHETFFPVMDQFTAVIELKQEETLDALWSGFRLGFARNFVFGGAALFTLVDQLQALLNPDYLY